MFSGRVYEAPKALASGPLAKSGNHVEAPNSIGAPVITDIMVPHSVSSYRIIYLK